MLAQIGIGKSVLGCPFFIGTEVVIAEQPDGFTGEGMLVLAQTLRSQLGRLLLITVALAIPGIIRTASTKSFSLAGFIFVSVSARLCQGLKLLASMTRAKLVFSGIFSAARVSV